MNPEQFGLFIQNRRKELGMKQADLAEKLNVTDKAVSRWERGVGFPDIKLLEPLADSLNVTLTELMQSQLIEETLSQEQVLQMEEQTQAEVEHQKKLSWQRKLILYVGKTIVLICGLFLIWIVHNTPWKEPWLGNAVRVITLTGTFFAYRALEYIVMQLYRKQRPFGMWHSIHTWIMFGMAILGARILGKAAFSEHYVLSLLLGIGLIFGAVFYYAYHEYEINAD